MSAQDLDEHEFTLDSQYDNEPVYSSQLQRPISPSPVRTGALQPDRTLSSDPAGSGDAEGSGRDSDSGSPDPSTPESCRVRVPTRRLGMRFFDSPVESPDRGGEYFNLSAPGLADPLELDDPETVFSDSERSGASTPGTLSSSLTELRTLGEDRPLAQLGAVPDDEHEDFLADLGDPVTDPKPGRWALRGHAFHLTYRTYVDPERLLDLVGGREILKYWSIVWELGLHGKSAEGEEEAIPYEHTHFYFHSTKRIQTRDCRHFDIACPGGQAIHPHIQIIFPKVLKLHEGRIYWRYHRKAPVRLWQSQSAPEDPEILLDKNKLRESFLAGSLLDVVIEKNIEIKSVSDVNLIRNERLPPPPATSEYSRTDFVLSVDWLSWWHLPGGISRRVEVDTLYLYGNSGLGKTEFAISLFARPLLVRSIDDARHFKPERYDGIVFDDVDITRFTAEQRIHLVDSRHTATVHCRYSDAQIPPGTRRVFTSNKPPEEFWRSSSGGNEEQYKAILRRIKVIHIVSPTFSTANL